MIASTIIAQLNEGKPTSNLIKSKSNALDFASKYDCMRCNVLKSNVVLDCIELSEKSSEKMAPHLIFSKLDCNIELFYVKNKKTLT